MANGIVILTAIVLLFVGMYVYSYSFEYFERMKEKRRLNDISKKEAMLIEQIALNQKAREEKVQKLIERSDEIAQELQRLKEFKKELSDEGQRDYNIA